MVFGYYTDQTASFDNLKEAWTKFLQYAIHCFYDEAWNACQDGSGFALAEDTFSALAEDLQTEDFHALEALGMQFHDSADEDDED